MTGLLPSGGFEPLTETEISRLSANNFAAIRNLEEGSAAYFLSVDAHCPPETMEKLRYYPLFPRHMTITSGDLSEMQYDQAQAMFGGHVPSMERLACTFLPIKDYGCHSSYLKMALAFGYVIERINYGWKAKEKFIFKNYVEGNLAKRAATTCSIASAMYKLASNCLWG